MLSVNQSPDRQDSAEYEAWIRQAKTNRFDEHVENLEEQYIDKEIDAHQVQSIDTVDHISANRQRQVPRTGKAQWQYSGDVSCEATQIPSRNLASSAHRQGEKGS